MLGGLDYRLRNWGRWGRQAGGPRVAESMVWRMVGDGDPDGYADPEGVRAPTEEPIDQRDAETLDVFIRGLPEPHRDVLIARYYLTAAKRKERRLEAPGYLETGSAMRALQDRIEASR